MSDQRSAHRDQGDDADGGRHAENPKAQRDKNQRRQQQKSERQAAGEGEQAKRDQADQQTRRLQRPLRSGEHAQTDRRCGDSRGADHRHAHGVAQPPGLKVRQYRRAGEEAQAQGGHQAGGERRQHGGADQQARGVFQGVHRQGRREPPRHRHCADDLDQVDDGEEDGKRRRIAREQFADQERRRHGREKGGVQRASPAALAKPHRRRQTARPPQGRHRSLGPRERQGQADQNDHPHPGDDGRQRPTQPTGPGSLDARLARARGFRSSEVERGARGHGEGLG